MDLLKDRQMKAVAGVGQSETSNEFWRARLANEHSGENYRPGKSVQLHEIAEELGLDEKAVLKAFAKFQSLGLATLGGNFSAIVCSPSSKDMRETYAIRAALEEIGGRKAAPSLKAYTASLRHQLDEMRAAVRHGSLDVYAQLNAKFDRCILEASQNDVLLQEWDTLRLDLRIFAAVEKVCKDIPRIVASHQPIVDAVENGRGRKAAVLLRNHEETFLECLKASGMDSGFHRALHSDLERAKDIQRAFFPPQSLSIPCIGCETFYQPAYEIGGDYYDLLSLQDGLWGIAIGDVSGKGIGAALTMASLQASLKAQTLHRHLELSKLIKHVNRLVYESSPTNTFVSLFYAEYEPAKRLVKYVNAGHNPPIVIRTRKGRCELLRLESTDIPLGIAADSTFAPMTFQFEVDDVLVAYTDGITEAANQDGELWGEQRLESLLRSCGSQKPEQIINSILDEVSAFASGQAQQDDMTLVVMGVQAGCGA